MGGSAGRIGGVLLTALVATAGSAQALPPGPDPARLLPPPFAAGSPDQQRELAQVRAAVAAAGPAERVEAAADDAHEDPGVFDATLGVPLERLPLTWALLKQVQAEADAAATQAKDQFRRTRPWGDDLRLTPCEAVGQRRPIRSYPSGHAMLGWSVGMVLAELAPARAPAVLARARLYAFHRLVCAEHYPSDIEASHALAAVLVTRLTAQPAFQARLAAARAELQTALAQPSTVIR